MKSKQTLTMTQVIEALSFKYNGNFNKIHDAIANKETADLEEYKKGKATLEAQGIKSITLLDEDYPSEYRNMNCPPFVIYIKGNKELLNSNLISVTGTPNPDQEGINNAYKTIDDMTKTKRALALTNEEGIEEKLNEAAKEKGISRVYFSTAFDRNKEVGEDELYVSERPFVQEETVEEKVAISRYRVGLSDAVCVVQSEMKNDIFDMSYVLLGFALDQGKEVYGYPMSLTSKKQGNNLMIQNGMNVSLNFEESLKENEKVAAELEEENEMMH